MLDLGDFGGAVAPPLQVSLSVPLFADSELIGVLTLYSAREQFTEDHRRVLEATGTQLAENVRRHSEWAAVRA